MNDFGWLCAVAQAHTSGAEDYAAGEVFVRRVRGGANNAVYRVRVDQDEYACKLFVADERHRAQREHAALQLLERAGLDIAPSPILIDETCSVLPFPVVAYCWIDGDALEPPLSDLQMSAILESIQAFHAIAPMDSKDAHLRDAWFHWFSFDPYLAELREFLNKYGKWLVSNDEGGKSLHARLESLVESCVAAVAKSRVDPTRGKIPLRLAHVDPNLANAIWDGQQRLRWVDWEYSGWGDPALELADLRWHIALEEVSEEQHEWFRTRYLRPKGDDEFEQRLAVWDRILATRWTFLIARLLWSSHNGPDRVRLTMPTESSVATRARLLRTIERAERFVGR